MANDVPPGEVYKGPPGIARDSIWLTNEDIPHDRDTVVTIESIIVRRKVKFQGGREKPVALSAKFKGKSRELLLNAGHRKILIGLFGPTAGDWFNRDVALYVEQDVRRADGSTGPAVRIRAKRVEQDKPAAAPVATTPREPGAD